jgi:hypothetical protein
VTAVTRCEIPANTLLAGYVRAGVYADCYAVDIDRLVSHAEYVEAFYTTALFKVERLILRHAVARPSTDLDAKRLAGAEVDTFSAWKVESRAQDELLVTDFTGRTRSWLMVSPSGTGAGTRLYFGSAVVPRRRAESEGNTLGWTFTSLLGFHKLYSRALLAAARRRLSS